MRPDHAGDADLGRDLCLELLGLGPGGHPAGAGAGGHAGVGGEVAAPWGLAGCSAAGSFVAVADEARLAPLVDALRAPLAHDPHAAVTLLGDVLCARALGAQARDVRARLEPIWSATRAALLGSPACPPRVWAT